MDVFNQRMYIAAAALLLTLAAGCVGKSEKAAPAPELAGFGSLDPMRAAMLRQRADDFTKAMVESFKTGDFKHWRAALEKERAELEKAKKKTTSSRKKSTVLDKAFSSAANTIGREIGKKLVRGLLGSLKF